MFLRKSPWKEIMRVLILILGLVILTSCTGKAPSKATFAFEVSTKHLDASGGLVIFGKTLDEKHAFTRVAGSTESIEEELVGGTWIVGAISWDGALPFSGDIFCVKKQVMIKGASVNVELPLTNDACFDPRNSFGTFLPSTAGQKFRSPIPSFCEGDLTSLSNPCSYNVNDSLPVKGHVGSYRFYIPGSYRSDSSRRLIPGEQLSSLCYSANTDMDVSTGLNSVGNLNIPMFHQALGFPLHILGYLGDRCEEDQGVLPLRLSDPASTKQLVYGAGQLILARTPIASICSTSDLFGAESFAAGVGTASNPWVICSESQLKLFQEKYIDNGYNNDHFVLGRNLSLLNYINMGAGSTPYNANIDFGDTFVPIGMKYVSSNWVQQTAFSGTFNGYNNLISHVRFQAGSTDNVGLFSELTAPAKISNLKIKDSQIEGRHYVGILAGLGTDSTLKNIEIEKSKVRGLDYVGGVIGELWDSSNLDEVSAKDMEVEGQDNVGGVLGLAHSSSVVKRAVFDGAITNRDFSSNVGGICGTCYCNLEEVVSSGYIIARGQNVGGIVGESASIVEARSDIFIRNFDQSTATKTGGIAGMGSGVIQRSFFTGSIMSSCGSGATCEVGAISGDSNHTPTAAFSTYSYGGAGVDGTLVTLIDIRNFSFLNDVCDNYSSSCDWTKNPFDYPRLVFEVGKEICIDVDRNQNPGVQVAAGTEKDPIIICNASQLQAVPSFSAANPGKFYELGQNINASAYTGNLGDFKGHLNGKGHMIHSLKSTGTDLSLFDEILSNSSIRNLKLVGFESLDPNVGDCTSCSKTTLAQANNGTISNVEVISLNFLTNDSTASSSGLVQVNNGTISNVRVDGEIRKSGGGFAGVVGQNTKTMNNVISEVILDAMGGAGNQIGGIVDTNNGTISRSKFSGRIAGLTNASIVGGIAAQMIHVDENTKLVDNEVSRSAEIITGSGTTFTGGILGYRFHSDSMIERNVFQGFILEPVPVNDIEPIVGVDLGPGPIPVNNYSFTSTYELIGIGTDSVSPAPSGSDCVLSLDMTSPIGAAVSAGAVRIRNRYYMGTVNKISNELFVVTIPFHGGGRCSQLGGDPANLEFYAARTAPSPIPVASALRAQGYEVLDATSGDDQLKLFKAYFQQLSVGTITTPPVWINDPGDNGFELFDFR